MAKDISGVSVPRKSTNKYSTDMPTLDTAAPTMAARGVGPVMTTLLPTEAHTISRKRRVPVSAASATAWLVTMA